MGDEWVSRAACAGLDPDLFHPNVGQAVLTQRAKRVCAGCDVRDECLAFAVSAEITAGIYGGLTADERWKLRRRPAGPRPISHGTEGGARTHLRRGEKPCPRCAEAVARAQRERSTRAS